jgi:hypothetical protein
MERKTPHRRAQIAIFRAAASTAERTLSMIRNFVRKSR